jgi:hypothetical protein
MPDPGFRKPDLCSIYAAALAPAARDAARTFGTGGGEWLITGRRSRRTGAGR